jgi:hypothetical protein
VQQYKVEKAEAANFAKIWRSKGGLVGTLDDFSVAFATDFANGVLRNFITMCQEQAKAAAKPKQAPEPEKKLIIEA